ncbi:MAG: hypothetical protein AB7K52_00455 [Phycisphaerales bacterium]
MTQDAPAPSTTSPPQGDGPAQPLHPPTIRGTAPSYRSRTIWPTVLGIICIVVGGAGALLSLWNAISYFIMPDFFKSLANTPGPGAAVAAIEPYLPMQAALSGVGVPIALLLLAGGAMLLVKRRWGPRLLFMWAIVKTVHGLVVCISLYLMQTAQFAAMANQGGPGAPPPGFMSGFAAIIAFAYMLWFLLLPVFIWVWFSRRAIRDEISEWPLRGRGGAHPAGARAAVPA